MVAFWSYFGILTASRRFLRSAISFLISSSTPSSPFSSFSFCWSIRSSAVLDADSAWAFAAAASALTRALSAKRPARREITIQRKRANPLKIFCYSCSFSWVSFRVRFECLPDVKISLSSEFVHQMLIQSSWMFCCIYFTCILFHIFPCIEKE